MKSQEKPSRQLTRRERKALRTRQSIIEATGRLFERYSYDKVTMDDISEEVDLSRATIYNYYGSKEAIYFEIGIERLDALNKNQSKIREMEGNGRDLVLYLTEDTLLHLKDDPLLYEIIRQYSISNSELDTPSHITLKKIAQGEDIEDSLRLSLSSFLKEMRIFEMNWVYAINKGYEDGSIAKELDVEQLAHFLFIIILGSVDRARLEKVLLDAIHLTFDKVTKLVVEMVRRYLSNP